jgi:uncharacterized repeat protein (TIGR01451 family)
MSLDRQAISRRTRRELMGCYFRPVHRWICLTLLFGVMAAPQIGQAEPILLSFDTFTPAADVADMHGLGPGYTGGLTMSFLHVATSEGTTIDARVTAIVQPNTLFATGTTNRAGRGFIPNYKATTSGEPKGDLGILYDGMDENLSGVTLTLAFFEGTGDRSGTFRDAYVVPDLQLLVYDVDGEPTQAEWFNAFYADGLSSYATGDAIARVTATPTDTGVHFLGAGKNLPETDTSGAVLLRYLNTSSITLAFGAEQYRAGLHTVFAAIDGGSRLPMTGSFQEPLAVPAPGSVPPIEVAEPPALQSRSGLWPTAGLYPAENVIRLDRLMPATVPLNVPFDYTLKVTNLTETPVHDVIVTERLPQNFQLQSSDPQPEKEGTNLHWKLGSLDPKASREIKVSGVATTAENLKPCATVSFVVPLYVEANVAVVEPKLMLAQTAPKEVLLGAPIPTQIVVTNAGTGILEGIKIVDTLPAGFTTLNGRSELLLDAGTLAPGQSRQFENSFRASKTGEFVHKILASAKGGLNAEASATTIVRRPVLALTKTGPARQYLGRPTTYEITVTNKGDAPAANVVVEDTLPPGAQKVQTSPAGQVLGSKVVWELETLAVNASRKVIVTYTPGEPGVLSQAATAVAVCAEPVTATAETMIYGIAAVLLEVLDTEDPVQVGGQTTYVITVTNQGSSPSHNIQITATVEDSEEIVAADGPTPVVMERNTARSVPLATLAPKADAKWRVTVKALKAGDVRFKVTLTTAELARPVEETEATQLYE